MPAVDEAPVIRSRTEGDGDASQPLRYESALPVLTRFISRSVQLCLLYTVAVKALLPAYVALHEAVVTSPAALALVGSLETKTPWVTIDDVFFTFGLSLAVGASYAIGNGLFYACDTYDLLAEFRLSRKAVQAPSAELIRRTLLKEAVSHCVTGPLIMLLAAGPGLRAVGSGVTASELPEATVIWRQMAVQLVTNESLFYLGHRLLHTPFLYRTIHKQHHSYIGTRSFAGEYAHAVEDVLTAYLPFLIGLFFTQAQYAPPSDTLRYPQSPSNTLNHPQHPYLPACSLPSNASPHAPPPYPPLCPSPPRVWLLAACLCGLHAYMHACFVWRYTMHT